MAPSSAMLHSNIQSQFSAIRTTMLLRSDSLTFLLFNAGTKTSLSVPALPGRTLCRDKTINLLSTASWHLAGSCRHRWSSFVAQMVTELQPHGTVLLTEAGT